MGEYEDTNTPWRDEEILRKLSKDEGMTRSEMAEELGCERTTIYNWLRRFGLTESKDYSDAPWRDEDTLRRLYWDEGKSLRETADHLNCGLKTVATWMERYGIERRDINSGDWRDEETLRRLYVNDELNTIEIAERFGTTSGTILRWMEKFGIERRRSRPQPPDDLKIDRDRIPDEMPWRDEETIRWLHGELGLGVQKMGELLDCSTGTARNWVDRFDVERGDPPTTNGPDIDEDRIPEEEPWKDEETLRWLFLDENLGKHTISDLLDIAQSTLDYWMNKFGIEKDVHWGKGNSNIPEKVELERLYRKKNLSTPEIAEELGVDNGTVYRWLDHYDVEIRSPIEYSEAPSELKDEDWMQEMYWEERLSLNEIARRVGTTAITVQRWLERHDIETRTKSEEMMGEYHPHWKGGMFPYGKGWNEQKKAAVRERDDQRCQSCGMTQRKCLEEYGRKLHVHHIIPAREVEDPKKRNAMENLVSMCHTCHNKWEGIPVAPTLSDS